LGEAFLFAQVADLLAEQSKRPVFHRASRLSAHGFWIHGL
jgi:hypothetical protein